MHITHFLEHSRNTDLPPELREECGLKAAELLGSRGLIMSLPFVLSHAQVSNNNIGILESLHNEQGEHSWKVRKAFGELAIKAILRDFNGTQAEWGVHQVQKLEEMIRNKFLPEATRFQAAVELLNLVTVLTTSHFALTQIKIGSENERYPEIVRSMFETARITLVQNWAPHTVIVNLRQELRTERHQTPPRPSKTLVR